ncbi:MAG TPA: hypothetical protein VM222_04720 [Planctomycetota bacterium]|nr:hypothetical protein [Planctomycetota bacterium]
MTLLLILGLLFQEPPPPTQPPAQAPGDEVRKEWEYSAQVYAYRIREDRDYLQPTFTADRDMLHLEARYNYEGHDTGSVWVGANFSLGDKVKLEVTPMLGVVFGQTAGVAPGLKATLSWWKLELYAEYEYMFVTADHHDSFSYTWSELTIAPWEWLSVGLVVQRTKVYETDFDVQRGFLARVFFKSIEITAAYFNPDEDPVYVLGLGLSF